MFGDLRLAAFFAKSCRAFDRGGELLRGASVLTARHSREDRETLVELELRSHSFSLNAPVKNDSETRLDLRDSLLSEPDRRAWPAAGKTLIAAAAIANLLGYVTQRASWLPPHARIES